MNTPHACIAGLLLPVLLALAPVADARCPTAIVWAQDFQRDHADFHSAARTQDLAWLTPRFASLLQREWAYADGEVGHLDYDPWLGAQDGEMAAAPSFTLIADDGHTASVAMRYPFALDAAGPRTPHEVRLLLERDAAHCWRLDDLVTPRGDALSTLYAAPDDATPAIDPDVVTVTSARWPGDAAGAIRAFVVERGYEHVSSEVHAQWLQLDDGDAPGWQIAASRELVPAGLQHIDSVEWAASGPHLQLVLRGRRTYEPDITVHCVFELSADGGARTLDSCGD